MAKQAGKYLWGAHPAVAALAAALGLDVRRTRAITLRAAVDSIVTVEAEMYVEEPTNESLTEIKKFNLMAVEEEVPVG